MPSSIRIELNGKGIADFLKSAEVRADVQRRVNAVQAAAGDGYSAVVFDGRDRVQGLVRTDTTEAREREAQQQSLLGVLHAGAS